jgi:hypothetical protein
MLDSLVVLLALYYVHCGKWFVFCDLIDTMAL